jgi:hypothetical protein
MIDKGLQLKFCEFLEKPDINIATDFFSEGNMVTEEDNARLEDKFTKSEIKRVVFESYPNGTPRPDGMSFIFYQKFWELVKMT